MCGGGLQPRHPKCGGGDLRPPPPHFGDPFIFVRGLWNSVWNVMPCGKPFCFCIVNCINIWKPLWFHDKSLARFFWRQTVWLPRLMALVRLIYLRFLGNLHPPFLYIFSCFYLYFCIFWDIKLIVYKRGAPEAPPTHYPINFISEK